MIRRAKQADAEKISKLISKNLKGNQKDKARGFLRYKRSPKKVKKIIKKSIVALVYLRDNNIIGFMNAYPKKKNKKKISWDDKKAKDYLENKKSAVAYLGVIDPKYNHQGIGTELYERMINDLRQKGYQYLFATTTVKPIKNKASLGFIKNKGFKKVAHTPKTAVFMKKLH